MRNNKTTARAWDYALNDADVWTISAYADDMMHHLHLA